MTANWKDTDILARLHRPLGKFQMVLDTDTYNEIDDQYALAYAVKSSERAVLQAVYAAPFSNDMAATPGEGMEKSYQEIFKVLELLGRQDLNKIVYRGSTGYLKDEQTPLPSAAARDLVERALAMPEGEPLYVAAIGAITNVASAILMQPEIVKKIVVVWLGGHAYFWPDTREFNLIQDIAAARVLFDSGVPLIQIPCCGVTTHASTTEPELRHHLKGKNPLCDYLYEITCAKALATSGKRCWSRVIWDVNVIDWLVGEPEAMRESVTHSPILTYQGTYSADTTRHLIKTIDYIDRDRVFERLFSVLAQ